MTYVCDNHMTYICDNHMIYFCHLGLASANIQLANGLDNLARTEEDANVALMLLKLGDVLLKISSLRTALGNIASMVFTDYFKDCKAMITAALVI